jgi:type II secretory pathway pseudopilin PulG
LPYESGSTSGFTLLETLLAAVALSLFAVAIIPSLANIASRTNERHLTLDRTEFARSFFAEYSSTGQSGSVTGIYEDRFAYNLEVTDQPPPEPGPFDEVIALYRLDLTVEDLRFGGEDSFVAVIARDR